MTTPRLSDVDQNLPLGDVCDFISGNAWKSKDFNRDGKGLPVIRIQNVGGEKDELVYWDKTYNDRYLVEPGDVLLSLSGSFRTVIWSGPVALLNQRVVKIVPSKSLTKEWLLYTLDSRLVQIEKLGRHALVNNVGLGDLREMKIPVPTIGEQKRIAAILDKANAIRRKRKEGIELCNQFLQSVFLEMFGDPIGNPHNYSVGTIRDLVSEVRYGTSAKAGASGEFEILRMNNLTYSGHLDLTDVKYIDLEKKNHAKYLVEYGDLLFNRTNSKELVGKTAVYDEEKPRALAGYLIRVRPNQKANTHFISAYLNSEHGKKVLQGMCKSIVGMANINAQELQDISILLPPIEEQTKFARLVESTKLRLKKMDDFLKGSDRLFGSLSQKAFKGDL